MSSRRRRTTLIVVHCAATPPDMDIGRAEIDAWHRGQGWAGIGYHYVIRRDGRLETGRDAAAVGAHAKGYNQTSVGICLVGGVDEAGKPEENFTTLQLQRLKALLAALQLVWPDTKIIGHNEIAKKACPSFDVQAWLATWQAKEEAKEGSENVRRQVTA